MEIITQKLQTDIKTAMNSWADMRNEALDLYNLYWKGGVKTDNDALATGTTPATQSTKLVKNDIINTATLVDVYGNSFFDNNAVATADRNQTCQELTHGNATPTLVSDRLEEFGDRAKQFAQDCLTQFNRSRDAENLYNSSELSAMIGSISAHTIVYGAEMSKDDLTSAITLMQQWQNSISNAAVTTGDYKVTLGKWERL